MDQRMSDWLKTELEKWVSDGIITPEQSGQIQMRYPSGRASSPLLVLFAVIGSLLIGAGVILVFATNWWSLPVMLRVVLAFLPLLLAQGVCLYTLKKRRGSPPFQEGSAVFLSLSFFAALALIGQIFHTSSGLSSYLLVCILLSLPGAYLFRSKAVMAIYVIGSLFVVGDQPMWVSFLLFALTLPYFFLAFKKAAHRRGLNFSLLLLSVMVSGTLITASASALSPLEITLNCGIALLLTDAFYRKLSPIYFFTSAKLLAIACITVALLITLFDLSFTTSVVPAGLALAAVLALAYFLLRRGVSLRLTAGDLFLCCAVALMLAARAAGVAACLLALGLGVYYIVRGSRTLALRHLNYGMALVILVFLIRFFDSSMGLLSRGLVSIALGLAFLGVNLYISRKRKGTGV